MCKCAKINLEDVAYRTANHDILPYHKSCGELLSEAQASQVDQRRRELWRLVETQPRPLKSKLGFLIP